MRVLTRALGGGVSVTAGYLGVLTAAAWDAHRRGRRRTFGAAPGGHRFLVLIPAHNEEQLIGQTLDSLAALDYPAERFEVHVVADNCTDATVDVARARGVEVHERNEVERPGKGASLQWLYERLDGEGRAHDAVVFVDADSTVGPNLLRVADELLGAGVDVVQCHYAVREDETSALVAFRSAAFAARTYLRPLGRTRIGGTAGLFGNGMVFRASALRGVSWTSHLTEDAELQLELLARGIRVAFAPDARVEAEMPDTLEASQSQHARWERGRIDLARRFLPGLLRQSVAGGPAGRVAAADAALDLLVPPFSVVAAANVAWSALALGQLVVRPTRARRRTFGRSLGAAGVHAAYVLSALRMVGAPPSVYRSLLGAPRLVVWKVGLWLRAIMRPGEIAWTRTSRNQPT